MGRPEQRKTATRSEWESGRERDREGRDEEEDPIRISIYSRKGSVKRREREEGGRGKECARGKGNLLFLSRSFETHIHRKRERNTQHGRAELWSGMEERLTDALDQGEWGGV